MSRYYSASILPQISGAYSFKHKARYQCQSTSVSSTSLPQFTVSRGQVLNTLIMNLTGSTSNARLISAIKVNRIEIWNSPAGSSAVNPGTPVTGFTTILEWSSTYGPARNITETTLGSTTPGHIVSSPPQNSLASFWSMSGSNESDVLFGLAMASQSIVDVSFEIVLSDLGVNSGTVTTSSSGTSSTVYSTYLDGPRSGAVMIPVGTPNLN
jgi:hypothetical protein